MSEKNMEKIISCQHKLKFEIVILILTKQNLE